MSSRPKSMSDFQSLLDASATLNGHGHPRKKPSISLAQGLMMTTESPRSNSLPDEPPTANSAPQGGPWSQNLFYAYAQKVYTTVPTPLLPLRPLARTGLANRTVSRATSPSPHPTSSPSPPPA